MCPESSIFSAQWRECGLGHGSSLRQTAALQAFKVRWDDPAAGILPERGSCWNERFFKQPGHVFLFKLSLKTQLFFHKRNLPVRRARIWASLKDGSPTQGPNSYLYHSSVSKLPLFKLTVAGVELKVRPSEGFIFTTSWCPEPESGSDHEPARGQGQMPAWGPPRKPHLCIRFSLTRCSSVTALPQAAELCWVTAPLCLNQASGSHAA